MFKQTVVAKGEISAVGGMRKLNKADWLYCGHAGVSIMDESIVMKQVKALYLLLRVS